MKKTILKKLLFLTLALMTAFVTAGLYGCSPSGNDGLSSGSSSAEPAGKAQAEPWKYNGEDTVVPGEKSETVTVKADASGEPEKITCSVTLSDIDGDSTIKDSSKLTNIKNKKGDEEFEAVDGTVYWQNKGSVIEYEGESDAAVPVSVDITYKLNGEVVSPADIKGASGEVTIRFDYHNDTVSNVAVDGGAYDMPVPFAAVTAVIFPEDVWDSIEVVNGKRTTLASQDVVMGIVFPGLKDSLGLDDKDLGEDLDLPEYFEIKGRTKNFRMDLSTTIFQNGIFSEMDDSDDINELTDSVDELADAADEIVKAAGKLQDGHKKLAKGIDGYLTGVESLDEGISSLSEGLSTLDSNTPDLKDGANGIGKSAGQIDEGMKQLIEMIPEDTDDPELAQIRAGLVELEKGTSALADGSDEFAKGVETFAKSITKLAGGAEKLEKGSGKLVKNNKAISDGLDSMGTGISKFKKGLTEFRDEGISEIVSFVKDDIADIDSRLKALKKRDSEYRSYSGADKKTDTSVMFIIETAEIS